VVGANNYVIMLHVPNIYCASVTDIEDMVFTGFCTFVCVVVWRKRVGEGEIGGEERTSVYGWRKINHCYIWNYIDDDGGCSVPVESPSCWPLTHYSIHIFHVCTLQNYMYL
jgi:hypothetical protein